MPEQHTRTEVLTHIEKENLGDIIRDYEDDGATRVKTESEPNGTFRVEAVFEKDV
jgi:hypothetical protein